LFFANETCVALSSQGRRSHKHHAQAVFTTNQFRPSIVIAFSYAQVLDSLVAYKYIIYTALLIYLVCALICIMRFCLFAVGPL